LPTGNVSYPKQEKFDTMTSISIVVPAYNGARTLKLCLESLSRLNYQDYEVIVVDDGSTNKTADMAEKLAMTILVCVIFGRRK